MSPTLTTGPGSSTSSSPLLSWTPCWKENWRNTLEGQLGSHRPPIYLVLRSVTDSDFYLRATIASDTRQKKLLYIALNKTQSSRCFGHHCDIGVPISDCIHWQSMNNKTRWLTTLFCQESWGLLFLCCPQETRCYPKGADRVQPPITGPEVAMTSHHHVDILTHYSLEMLQFRGYQYTTREGKSKVRVVRTPQPTNFGAQLSVKGDITLQMHQFAIIF